MVDLIPPRYAVGDGDFDPELGRRPIISLDGAVLDQVVAYDIEAGVVAKHGVDVHGEVVVDREREEIVKVDMHGTATVTLKP
ncbi:hypothetical protein [Novosphingobium sp. P6W]|uniref:hypothetical protein n=1 Tax=Novosphingobium sp. P6W TaxID=1609758 RepID=UPI0005C2A440|nr:hypothetical protein [Novosphingobium sp. P6W]AXB79129.1 hypothetical protein TQ38_021570 [Novosphingobium sp. P6W]KIS30404.1 hypothetical protein TQ38_22510 [Novosphingobium sp. P6W]